MPLLITAADVLGIYDTDRDETSLAPILDVTEAFVAARPALVALPNATRKDVERYVAAHVLFVTDAGMYESLRVEDVSERFTKNEKNPGLLDSRWGRMAVMLDTSGTLRSETKIQPKADIRLMSSC